MNANTLILTVTAVGFLGLLVAVFAVPAPRAMPESAAHAHHGPSAAGSMGGGAPRTAGPMGAHDHDHARLVAVPSAEAPGLDVTVTPDPVAGYNVRIATTNFRFAPERAGLAHRAGEGHAHIYADGVKLARVYGEWVHVTVAPATKTLTVTLNSNDHGTLAVDGVPVSRTLALPSGAKAASAGP